jgi:C4-dicarboxylate-specific signal transduction histidine kinase
MPLLAVAGELTAAVAHEINQSGALPLISL